jgi:hypothetical protein
MSKLKCSKSCIVFGDEKNKQGGGLARIKIYTHILFSLGKKKNGRAGWI